MSTASRSRLGRRHKPCSICKKTHAPWWNSEKGRWYLSLPVTGTPGKWRKVSLGDDHDKAIERWHRIEAGLESTDPLAMPTATTDTVLVGELINLFLDSKSAAPSPKRYKITKRFLQEFARSFGAMPVAALRVGGIEKIERWLDAHKNWNGCRPDVVGRIRRLFNWSAQQGYIPSSPVAGLKKPRYNVRVSTFSPEQIEAILAEANDFFARGFRMLLLTGCRPDEICSLTDSDVHEDSSGLYLLVNHKNQRHTGKPRRVFLVPEAAQIIREQQAKYKGRLFRSIAHLRIGDHCIRRPEGRGRTPSQFSAFLRRRFRSCGRFG